MENKQQIKNLKISNVLMLVLSAISAFLTVWYIINSSLPFGVGVEFNIPFGVVVAGLCVLTVLILASAIFGYKVTSEPKLAKALSIFNGVPWFISLLMFIIVFRVGMIHWVYFLIFGVISSLHTTFAQEIAKAAKNEEK